MTKAWLLAALLLAGLLAGCAGKAPATPAGPAQPGYLSPQAFAIKAPELMMLPASTDQVKLEVVLYRPDTAERVPVFVNFSPYWGDTAMREGDAFSQHFIHEYVPRGYAVALASVRGTGHSEGCFQIGGDLELKDAYDVVDYLAKQPWSNGNVGAGGKSYDSTTQNGLVAKFPHPALKTLFHVSGITDMYRYSAKDGVAYENGLSFTPRYFLTEGADEYGVIPPPLGTGGGTPEDESPDSLQRLVGDLACPELAKHLQSGEGTAASGIKDAYWQERDWIRHLPQSTWNGSVLFVHGFQDWNVKPDHIDPWLQALAAKGNPVKGWLHQWTQAGTGHVYPMRTDWNVTMLRWLDHTLKGVDNGIDRELGFDLQGSDTVWRRSPAWPPTGRNAQASGPLASGSLEVARASTPLRVTGTPALTVAATSLSADPILYARLVDVAPNGTTLQVNEAARRGALSADLSATSPWPPGETRAANLTFYPMDHVLLPKHRLLLQVGVPLPTAADTADPRPGPHGNAGFVITPAQGRVTYGEGTLHFLLLDASANRIDPQPQPMKCFAC